jgi:hypothetical protein
MRGDRRRQRKEIARALPPLRRFDYALIRDRLEGLYININRTLERRGKAAGSQGDHDGEREYFLLVAMVRIAYNAYGAVRYLVAETPEDPGRKPTFVLVSPAVNRHLMDLLFTLVYMLDDFRPRALAFQRATWRELSDELQRYRIAYKHNPEWKWYFHQMKNAKSFSIALLKLTPAQVKKPSTIAYWKHPGELKEEPGTSRPFLRWLYKWLYVDTSAQAHLSAGGLFMLAPFLLADLIDGSGERLTAEYYKNRREYQSFRFLHFSRTTLMLLAIATELNARFTLRCNEAVDYLWTIIREFVPKGKDMYDERYAVLLSSPENNAMS